VSDRPRVQKWRVLCAVLAFASVGAAKCPKTTKAAPVAARAKKNALPDSADQVMYGQRTVLANRGVNGGELLSDSAYVYEDGARLDFFRVNMTFFTSQGLKDGVLTSKTGKYNSRLQRLEARGDVVVIRDDGKRLSTPQLVFDQARNQIFSDTTFTLVEPSRQLTGIAFESDPHFSNFKCLRACKIVASVKIPVK